MRWAEITVEIPAESSEAVTALLLGTGCPGVAEAGNESRLLTGYLPVSDDLQPVLDALQSRLQRLPDFGLPAPVSITLRYVDDADWANEWKKHFQPLEIGRRLVVKPSWATYNGDPGRVIVELDPGMAFGTGNHPTTRLCLLALEDCVEPGCVVADIGTGSGILALAAARLGASIVHATDIDSLPRRIARENVERSGLQNVICVHDMEAFDAAARDCDLVVANIIADTIIELAPAVSHRLKPGGVFISSGIVEEKLPDVLAALERSGFHIMEIREEEIWRAVVARAGDAA
jgi:ribosomal protein L11 methyltransferase